jgi:hypothetical protein
MDAIDFELPRCNFSYCVSPVSAVSSATGSAIERDPSLSVAPGGSQTAVCSGKIFGETNYLSTKPELSTVVLGRLAAGDRKHERYRTVERMASGFAQEFILRKFTPAAKDNSNESR